MLWPMVSSGSSVRMTNTTAVNSTARTVTGTLRWYFFAPLTGLLEATPSAPEAAAAAAAAAAVAAVAVAVAVAAAEEAVDGEEDEDSVVDLEDDMAPKKKKTQKKN